jgi:glycosyltransferase involved in cell wall biosynthesis
MKILHVIAGVNPAGGGPIEGILRQAEVWARHGHQREIVSLDNPDDPWVKDCPVKCYALGIRSTIYRRMQGIIPWLRYGYSPKLVPWLSSHAANYDAIIVNGLWNYTAFASLRALADAGVPYFVFTHGQLDPWFREFYPVKNIAKQILWLFSEGRLLRRARAVLFTSEAERRKARNAFWPYQMREKLIGYGTADVVDEPARQMEALYACMPQLADRRFLLFLSRIHPKKGCDILIRAFARYARNYPDLDLVIAGPDQTGWRLELEHLADEAGVSGRIHWPGMLTGDAKWGAYRAAEAFALPSHSENFGIVVAEALACGCPVLITTQVDIWREVLAGGGGLVSRDNEKEFARIVGEFLERSLEERTDMAIAARNTFVLRFDIEFVAMSMLARLQDLVADDAV